jgi:hypothetical protein
LRIRKKYIRICYRYAGMKRLVAAVVAILLNFSTSPAQDAGVEYQVKAAFLFNFAKFVEWPTRVFPARNSPFTICLAGDPFQGAVEKTIVGETWNGRPLAVKRIDSGDEVTGCQLLYVSRSMARSMDFLAAAANGPVLTVGETEDFISSGGIIRFTASGRRIRFEINPDAAERVSLRVSSRLLRLADIVRPPQRAGN